MNLGKEFPSAIGSAAFGRKPPFEFPAEVCGALPERRYGRRIIRHPLEN